MADPIPDPGIHTRPFLDEMFAPRTPVRAFATDQSEDTENIVSSGTLHLFAAATRASSSSLVNKPDPDGIDLSPAPVEVSDRSRAGQVDWRLVDTLV